MVEETENLGDRDEGTTTPLRPDVDPVPADRTVKLDLAIANRDPSLPSHFGRYEVLERIGIGGFASVFSARDPELDSAVAIKVLAENHSADVEVRRRFVAEARVARRLGSDRLIGVFDLGETPDGRPYVVMELASGGTLRARLGRLGRPSPDDLVRLISELGQCMIAIHDKGVVHRDIKPSNLLLRTDTPQGDERPTKLIEDDERLVLADLGLARDISGGASALTVGGGTVGYMAPEQADPKGKADHRADIYAATVVVAELTTGRHPERLDLTTARLTEPVLEVLQQGMAIDRDDRPTSAADWRDRMLDAYGSDAPTRLIAPDNDVDTTRVYAPTAIQPPYPSDSAEGGNDDEDRSHDPVDLDEASTPEHWLEPRTYVEPPDPGDPPPPPPPSIPLSPRTQRPPPERDPNPGGSPPPAVAPAAGGRMDAGSGALRPAAGVTMPGSGPPAEPIPLQPDPAAPEPAAPGSAGPAPPTPPSGPVPPAIVDRHRPAPAPPQSGTAAPPQSGAPAPPQSGAPAPPAGPPVYPPVAGPPRGAAPQPVARQHVTAPDAAGPPIGAPPAPPRHQPQRWPAGPAQIGPGLSEERSRRHLRTAQRLARLEQKAARKRARRRRRQRRWRRISNFFRALIRGVLAALLTTIAASIFFAAVTGRAPGALPPRAEGAVNLLTIAAFFLGMMVFPWPRRLEA